LSKFVLTKKIKVFQQLLGREKEKYNDILILQAGFEKDTSKIKNKKEH
jgi:hypothetical protein